MILMEGIDYRKLTQKERSDEKKYLLLKVQSIKTIIRGNPGDVFSEDMSVVLTPGGHIVCYPGFRWDGPSGPTFDSASTMRASLFHDALYLLFREEKLNRELYRYVADFILYRLMIEDGAWHWRATLWLWTVWAFAKDKSIGRLN